MMLDSLAALEGALQAGTFVGGAAATSRLALLSQSNERHAKSERVTRAKSERVTRAKSERVTRAKSERVSRGKQEPGPHSLLF